MKIRHLLRALLLLGLAAGASAQAPAPTNPPPAAAFHEWAEMEEVQLSPSGRYVALTTAKLTGRRVLYVFDLNPGGVPTQAASYRDMDVVNVRWVSDQRLVFQLEDRSLPGYSAGQRYAGLLAVDRDGQRERRLGGYRLLGVPQDGSDEVLVGERRGGGMRPMRLNVNSGRARAFEDLRSPSSEVDNWIPDSQGRPRIAASFNADNYQSRVWARPDPQGDWQLIAEGETLKMPFTPVFMDDLGTLYVSEPSGPGATAVLKRFDFKAGKPEREPLLQVPGFDVQAEFIGKPGAGALGLRIETDAEQTVWFDAKMRAFQQQVDAKLPGRINHISCRQCGDDEMVALVFSYSDREPGHYYVVRGKDRQWQSVGRVRPAIDAEQMGRVDFQRIKARDGRDLPVWMTIPKGVKPGQPAPTVVLVHGGPWVRIGYWRWNPDAQFLASRGYLVIEPEFRGSEGYGRAHMEASFKQWGQSMQDDVADALLWAQKQGLASDKACIAGGSYGGYATFAGLMRHPELYRCGLSYVAVTDLLLFTKGSAFVDTDVSNAGRRYSYAVMVGDPDKDAELLRAHSPVHQAARIKAPVMLVMGEADRRVPIAHGIRMRDAMKAAGNPVEWHSYPEEGHGWYLAANRIDFANRMEGFFAKHLR